MKKNSILVFIFVILIVLPVLFNNNKQNAKKDNLEVQENLLALSSNHELSEDEKKQIAYEWLDEITDNELLKKALYEDLKYQEETYGYKIEDWKLLK